MEWGDGTWDHITEYNQPQVKHKYSQPGTYTLKMNGKLEGFGFGWCSDREFEKKRYTTRFQITDISQWGCVELSPNGHQFSGCAQLLISAVDKPNLSNVTSLEYAFAGSGISTANMRAWDTSNITSLSGCFQFAENFRGDVSGWDTSQVTDMNNTCSHADRFDCDLSQWNTSRVTSMAQMFSCTLQFNGDVSSWDVSKVKRFERMFSRAAAFNGNHNNLS